MSEYGPHIDPHAAKVQLAFVAQVCRCALGSRLTLSVQIFWVTSTVLAFLQGLAEGHNDLDKVVQTISNPAQGSMPVSINLDALCGEG